MTSLREALIKLIPFMPFDLAQESLRHARHERNQAFAVRPELVEGLIQRFLRRSKPRAQAAPAGGRLQRRGQCGFSLLEILVAFSILALCLGVLLRIFAGSGRLSGLSEEHARAVVLAESLLAQVDVETPLQLGETSGQIDETYNWAMRVSPFEPPGGEPLPQQLPFKPYWVELAVEWGEGSDLHAFKLATLRLVGNGDRGGLGQPGGLVPGASGPR